MSLTNDGLKENGNGWKSAPHLPVMVLILVQLAGGMRDVPQFSFFLIYLQEQLQQTPAAISSVVAAAQFTGMIMALLGGAIAARLGRKWVLVGGLTLSGLASLVFQTHSLPLVIGLWLAGGAGLAMTSVGGASYLTRISERGSLGILAAFYALSVTIGGAIGNPLAGVIIEQSGFVAFSWGAIALSVGVILAVVFLMPHFQDHAPQSPAPRSFVSGIAFTIRQPNVRLLIGLRSLPTIFYGMISVHVPLLLNNVSGSKVLVAAYITTTLVVASAAQLLTGRAADRWGARGPAFVAYSVLICSGLGLALSTGSITGLFVFGVLGIAGAWSLSTLMYVWINDGVPKAEHPATFGLLHAVWSLSMMTGSMVGGWFISTLPGLPFLLAGLLNAGSLGLIRFYYSRTSVKEAVNLRNLQGSARVD